MHFAPLPRPNHDSPGRKRSRSQSRGRSRGRSRSDGGSRSRSRSRSRGRGVGGGRVSRGRSRSWDASPPRTRTHTRTRGHTRDTGRDGGARHAGTSLPPSPSPSPYPRTRAGDGGDGGASPGCAPPDPTTAMVQDQLLLLMCEQAPGSVCDLLLTVPSVFSHFFTASDLRIMAWFSHFSIEGMRGFRYGAYALAHFCLQHRDEVWRGVERGGESGGGGGMQWEREVA